MKTGFIAFTVLASIMAANSAQVLWEANWTNLAASGQLKGGVPIVADGKTSLKLSATNTSGPNRIAILTMTAPAIKGMSYSLVGRVRYEEVKGDGFLELWSVFRDRATGPEAAYFSRTLGNVGAMKKISGTEGWRKFILPFDRTGTSNPPIRLDLNLVLPSTGTVYLDSVQLVEPADFGAAGSGVPGEWWSERASGLLGGLAGGIGGCFAGLLGWLASRGQCRGLVLNGLRLLIGLGGISTLTGLVAVLMKQPYHVWFPLLLIGVLLLGILIPRLRGFERQFAEWELRRMSAVDSLGA